MWIWHTDTWCTACCSHLSTSQVKLLTRWPSTTDTLTQKLGTLHLGTLAMLLTIYTLENSTNTVICLQILSCKTTELFTDFERSTVTWEWRIEEKEGECYQLWEVFAGWLLWCNWSHDDCLTLLRHWLLLCFLLPSCCCCCCVLSQGIHNSSDCTSNAASVDQIVVIFNFLDSASYQAAARNKDTMSWRKAATRNTKPAIIRWQEGKNGPSHFCNQSCFHFQTNVRFRISARSDIWLIF